MRFSEVAAKWAPPDLYPTWLAYLEERCQTPDTAMPEDVAAFVDKDDEPIKTMDDLCMVASSKGHPLGCFRSARARHPKRLEYDSAQSANLRDTLADFAKRLREGPGDSSAWRTQLQAVAAATGPSSVTVRRSVDWAKWAFLVTVAAFLKPSSWTTDPLWDALVRTAVASWAFATRAIDSLVGVLV